MCWLTYSFIIISRERFWGLLSICKVCVTVDIEGIVGDDLFVGSTSVVLYFVKLGIVANFKSLIENIHLNILVQKTPFAGQVVFLANNKKNKFLLNANKVCITKEQNYPR